MQTAGADMSMHTDEPRVEIRGVARIAGAAGFSRAIWQWVPRPTRAFAALAGGVAVHGLGHAAMALAAGLIGRALAGASGRNATDVGGWTVVEIAYIGLAAVLVKAMAQVFLAYFEARLAADTGAALRKAVTGRLIEAGPHDAPPRVLATIAVRVRDVEHAMAQGVVTGLRGVGQLVPLALALIFVSPRLAAGAALLLAPFALITAQVRRRFRRESERAASEVEALSVGVDELVRNLDLWRSTGAGERICREIDRASSRAALAASRVEAWRSALSGGNEVLGAFALVGALALASAFGLPMGDGTLIAFAAVFFMAYRPLRDVGDAQSALTRGDAALAALAAIGRALRPVSRVESTAAAGALGELTLTALGAREHGPRTSCSIRPGEMVGVHGPTGSGKTTLLRVLLGLEPGVGQLRYGDVDLSDAGCGPDARPFAWVPQDAPLITGTVLDNVALTSGDADGARAALAALGAESLLELGATRVGPGGRALSGGERRLLSMARALATGLPVLLLDEPTEGLDAEAQGRVLAALQRLKGERTLLVVTHRSEVLALADRVVPIGADVERGSAEAAE